MFLQRGAAGDQGGGAKTPVGMLSTVEGGEDEKKKNKKVDR